MKRILFTFFLLFGIQAIFSQIRDFGGGFEKSRSGIEVNQNLDSISDNEIDVKLSGKTKYTDYKIISFRRDTTIVDTTLTIQKEYKFNFLRKDNFELLAFQNQGQTFNNLGYDFQRTTLFPDIGFRAKQFNFFNIEDVSYYQVPTPTTEIMYRTGLEQGQILDALFTLNFSKRFNIGVAYRGLRSLGKYRRSLASNGNFRMSFHYETPKGQYNLKGQIVNQDISNEENGGLTEVSLENFVTDNPNFSSNRGRLDINLENAENILEGRRIYFEHTFKLISTKDSLLQKDFSNLKVGHSFTRDSKYYRFTQSTITDAVFGETNGSTALSNKTDYLLYNNQLFLDFDSKYVLGRFRVKTNYTTYNYGYDDDLLNINAATVVTKSKLKGKAVSFGADWNAKVNDFYLNASAHITPGSSRLSGTNFYGEAFYKKDSLFTVKGRLSLSSKAPNFNFLLHQSTYNAYNWQNDFSNIETRNLGGTIESKWGNASIDLTNIDNYTYFDTNGIAKQASSSLTYLKAKLSREFTFGKFALDNTLMYQKVKNSAILRVPEFVTRNTLYYSDSWFKGDPLYVQIGATLKYFTKYKANAYNPLLAEFTLQNTTEIGYPTVDVFFNARVRRTRIYFKIDNATSGFTKKNYFSAPNYPYRDFVIRFGLVWNWFI